MRDNMRAHGVGMEGVDAGRDRALVGRRERNPKNRLEARTISEIRIRMTDAERAEVERRAAERGMTGRDYARALLFAPDRPVDERELLAMVSAKARKGDIRAMGILARRMPATVAPAPTVQAAIDDPLAAVDELAERRRARAV